MHGIIIGQEAGRKEDSVRPQKKPATMKVTG
jgi:hypothetical protein